MTPIQVTEFFSILESLNPNPKTELEYKNAFTLTVAVVLSAQATDKSVNHATKDLFALYDKPEEFLKLGEDGLKQYIKSIGLFNSKARNIIKMCEILVRDHKGEVPSTREELEALPGVGRKTANVILNVYFDQNTMAVDTHIFRVANRTGLARGKTPLEVERVLLKVIPERWLRNAHHWLILHGRYICMARKPRCVDCPVSHLCDFFKGE